MGRMRGEADRVTAEFREDQPGQHRLRHFDEHGDVNLVVAQTLQHFLSGKVVQDDTHAGTGFLKIPQGAGQ